MGQAKKIMSPAKVDPSSSTAVKKAATTGNLRPATKAASSKALVVRKDGSTPAPHRAVRKFNKYNRYVHAILKQTHGTMGLKQRSSDIFNAIIGSMIRTLTTEAVRCKRAAGRQTLTGSDVRNAVRLSFPVEMSSYMNKAVDAAVAEHAKNAEAMKARRSP